MGRRGHANPPPNGREGLSDAGRGLNGESVGGQCLDSMVKEARDGSQGGQSPDFGSRGTQRRQRARLSRLKYWRVVRVDQALGGAFARATILRRALTNSSYEGCPRPRRMVSPLACRATRPARLMTPKRTAFNRLLTHSLPNTNRFTAEFRLNANTVIAHHAALAPNSPDGSLPPAKSSFSTACTSSPLPHLCLYHHTNSSPVRPRLVTTPVTLYQPPSPICIVGTDNSS